MTNCQYAVVTLRKGRCCECMVPCALLPPKTSRRDGNHRWCLRNTLRDWGLPRKVGLLQHCIRPYTPEESQSQNSHRTVCSEMT